MSVIAMTCEQFEAHLEAYLEEGLDAATHAACDAHRARCSRCAALVADLDHIVGSAQRLPLPPLSGDLWPAIEAQLQTSVHSIPRVATASHPFMTWRRLAAAAAVLVSVSAGLTWSIARRTPASGNERATVASLDAGAADAARERSARGADRTRDIDPSLANTVDGMPPTIMGGALSGDTRSGLVAGGAAGTAGGAGRTASGAPVLAAANTGRVLALDTLYGREIALLRTVAETRLGLLDSSTVSIVRRNLDIIDNAIRESRLALANDPNSGFLLDQLDRAYERKVDLLRQLALL